METQIPHLFPDGSREALGFIVNPLVYGYGLPLLFGLVMASGVSLLRKSGHFTDRLRVCHVDPGLGCCLADTEDAGL